MLGFLFFSSGVATARVPVLQSGVGQDSKVFDTLLLFEESGGLVFVQSKIYDGSIFHQKELTELFTFLLLFFFDASC